MEDHRKEAQNYLGILRRGTDLYENFLEYLRREVQKGGFTLKDIGTSEEELKELQVKGCKTSAQNYLGILRRGTDLYEN